METKRPNTNMAGLYAEAGGPFCSLSHIARAPADRPVLLPALYGNVQNPEGVRRFNPPWQKTRTRR
jgi:hypothetical protein